MRGWGCWQENLVETPTRSHLRRGWEPGHERPHLLAFGARVGSWGLEKPVSRLERGGDQKPYWGHAVINLYRKHVTSFGFWGPRGVFFTSLTSRPILSHYSVRTEISCRFGSTSDGDPVLPPEQPFYPSICFLPLFPHPTVPSELLGPSDK